MELLKEAAVPQALNVSVSTLRRWRSKGKGPLFHKLNGAVRYSQDDVKQFAEDRICSSTSRCKAR
jgi:predicted site-specific integrase-resolvase